MKKILNYVVAILIIGSLTIPTINGVEIKPYNMNSLKNYDNKDAELFNNMMDENQVNYDDQLDQQQPDSNRFTFVIDLAHRAQSFKPQLEVLTRVELYMYKYGNINSDIVISIRDNLYGNDLTVCSKSAYQIPTEAAWIEFDFNDLTVNLGNTYYIVCSTNSGNFENCYTIGYAELNPDPYQYGEIWEYGFFTDYEWEPMCYNCDLSFKTYGKLEENEPPVADFYWNPNIPNIGENIYFDASESYDPDGDITLYQWDWNNDGIVDESSDLPETTQIWFVQGTYPVTLKVTDNDGLTDTITKNVVINDDMNQNPIANFEWAPSQPKINENIIFDASYSFDPDGNIRLYEWDWNNDGIFDESNTDPTISYSWTKPGNYPVKLKVVDNDNLDNSITRTISIVKEWSIVVPDDYPTIQDAIDHSQLGERIFVRSGTYIGGFVVSVGGIIIHGENKGDTIINGVAGNHVIQIEDNANGVNISGFTIGGVLTSDPSPSSYNNNAGIYVESDYNIIYDNNIQKNSVGIEFYHSSGTQLFDNQINDNSWGIILNEDTHGISINRNSVENNEFHGISIDEISTGNTLKENLISRNGQNGIEITDVSKGNFISWNTIDNNIIGISCGGFSDGNLFHHNSLIDNNQNAYDSSIDRWYSDVQGNYWSDYDGEDINGDGIGDTPYYISGGDNVDNYPLMSLSNTEKIDAAAMDIFFSSVTYDKYRSYEIPSLREGDLCYVTIRWDIIPDQFISQYHWESVEEIIFLDGKILYDEEDVARYPWYPIRNWLVHHFTGWFEWTATPGNHSFYVEFDPNDYWDEANENNNELIYNFTVPVQGDIVARFTWTPEKPQVNDQIIFDASESIDKNGQIISYEWDWNDDGIFDETCSNPTVTHVWSISDSYQVTLKITNNKGMSNTITKTITVFENTVFHVPQDFPTIQEAINNAIDGMTIHVASNIYQENIIIDKPLKLIGEDVTKTIIDGGGIDKHVIRILADNVEISGFTIKDCNIGFSGIRVYGNATAIHHNIISNCGGAIELYWTRNNLIFDNTLLGNNWGLYIDNSFDCVIDSNTIYENSYGIETGLSSIDIIYNAITDNINHGIFEIQDSQMKIHSNNLSFNGGDGIRMFSSQVNDILENDLYGNMLNGMQIHKSTLNNIHENKIINNQESPLSLCYHSDENNIEKNEINSKNLLGINLDYCNDNQIKNNICLQENEDPNAVSIRISRTSHSNAIYHNNFMNSSCTYDECGNTWDFGSLYGGNYWQDISVSDIDANGIGDVPHNILGGGSQDHYPLIYPFDPPEKPDTPTGSINGKIRKEYSFQTSTTDPKGDRVQYGWDWDGDENIDEWTGFYNSGETITVYHSWNKKGTYNILVLARDEHGHVSDWSEPLPSTMAKNKLYKNNLLLKFLENHPYLFPLLKQLKGDRDSKKLQSILTNSPS